MKSKSVVSATIVLLILLLGFLFLSYNQRSKVYGAEGFSSMGEAQRAYPSVADESNKLARPGAASSGVGSFAAGVDGIGGNVQPQPVAGGDAFASAAPASGSGGPSAACFPKDRLSGEDLLPRDAANSKWAQMNPAGQGDVRDANFLTAGYHVGIDTVGSSMRNPNLQLRSEPPAPTTPVSPWMISSITYSDVNRRPLEIGGDY